MQVTLELLLELAREFKSTDVRYHMREMDIVYLSEMIIGAGKVFERQREPRIEFLKTHGPTVEYNEGSMIVCVLRDDLEKYYAFEADSIRIERSEDGYVIKHSVDWLSLIISEHEYSIIQKRLEDARKIEAMNIESMNQF